jgi:hypothetical protein
MRHTFQVPVVAVFLSLALSAGGRLFAAEPPATSAKPPQTATLSFSTVAVEAAPQKSPTIMEKLKTLGALLGRTLEATIDLLHDNQTDVLSRNHATVLSGNTPTILSGNNTKLLSENTTPILSGNTFSMFSNIKVEIHIDNSAGAMAQPGNAATQPSAASPASPPTSVPTFTIPPPSGALSGIQAEPAVPTVQTAPVNEAPSAQAAPAPRE